jgi:uncharacterized protein
VTNTENIKTKSGLVYLVLLCLAYLVALAGAEYVTYYINPLTGIILHFIILLVLIINSAVAHDEAMRGLWLALGLVPLVRIIGLVMPISEISEIYMYIIVAAPIFLGAVAVIFNLKYTLDDDIGLNRKKALIQVLVAISGLGLGFLDYMILKPESLISELTLQMMLIPALILLVATGFVEELVFRGIIQRAARALGSWGWVYVALIYTVLQMGQGSVEHIVFVFLVSIFFGWIVKKTGSIIGVSVSHGLLNIALYLVLPHVGLNLTIPWLF